MLALALLPQAMHACLFASSQDSVPSETLPTAAEASDPEIDARIAELETRVEALIARIIILETTLAQQRGQSEKNEAAADISDFQGQPSAKRPSKRDQALDSPELIMQKMQDDFQNDLLRDPSFVLGIDSPNMRAQDEADRVLRNWMEKNTRTFKKPVSWNVRTLKKEKMEDGDTRFLFQIIRSSGSEDSEPFEQIIASRFERRIKSWEAKHGYDGLTLRGFFEPELSIAPSKPEIDEMKTEVIFSRETSVALNEWVFFDYALRLSSVVPRFKEIEADETTEKTDMKGDSKDEL
jgi:hypothetical protein